jgi:predicted lipoprotein with Yx(FWY)xxD motif
MAKDLPNGGAFMRSKPLAVLVAVSALGLAVGGTAAVVAGASDRAVSAAKSRATLTVHKTRFGRVIFDGRGRVLYLFARDKSTKSTCSGACAKAWPPFLTRGTPKAARGARQGLIGTTRRKDGSRQVTYGGHPLYYFEGDGKGEVKCQNVNNFGGLWLVVSPNGKAVR